MMTARGSFDLKSPLSSRGHRHTRLERFPEIVEISLDLRKCVREELDDSNSQISKKRGLIMSDFRVFPVVEDKCRI